MIYLQSDSLKTLLGKLLRFIILGMQTQTWARYSEILIKLFCLCNDYRFSITNILQKIAQYRSGQIYESRMKI